VKRQPHPVRGAYAYAREDIPCPNCKAEPFIWCQHPDGRVRWSPCVSRLEVREDSEGPDRPPPVLRIVRNPEVEDPQ
jgi:hypothetical protein